MGSGCLTERLELFLCPYCSTRGPKKRMVLASDLRPGSVLVLDCRREGLCLSRFLPLEHARGHRRYREVHLCRAQERVAFDLVRVILIRLAGVGASGKWMAREGRDHARVTRAREPERSAQHQHSASILLPTDHETACPHAKGNSGDDSLDCLPPLTTWAYCQSGIGSHRPKRPMAQLRPA